jgi:hypothetical protein
MATKLSADDIAKPDPYKFMAVIGKRVIHPGGAGLTTLEVAARPAHVRKTAWLMPHMAEAVPCLGYIVVEARKPT